MAKAAGVSDVDAVESAIEDGQYQRPVDRTTERAESIGVQGTPTLAIDGKLVNALREDAVRSVIEGALG